MKIISLAACALLALSLQVSAQAPAAAGAIKLGKVQPAVVNTPEFTLKSGGDKRSKPGDWLEIEVEFDTKGGEIDELTLEYTVQVENKLLEGQVTHVMIPPGREHFSVMYVSPRSLDKLTGGKALNASSIQNAWIIAKIKGQIVDQAAFRREAIPNLQKTPGMLLNKAETPFAPLYFDRYEAIKAGK
jgi:hypothetical protein